MNPVAFTIISTRKEIDFVLKPQVSHLVTSDSSMTIGAADKAILTNEVRNKERNE